MVATNLNWLAGFLNHRQYQKKILLIYTHTHICIKFESFPPKKKWVPLNDPWYPKKSLIWFFYIPYNWVVFHPQQIPKTTKDPCSRCYRRLPWSGNSLFGASFGQGLTSSQAKPRWAHKETIIWLVVEPPISKILVKMDHFNIQKYLKTTT